MTMLCRNFGPAGIYWEPSVYKYLIAATLGIFVSLASAQDVKVVYHITTGVDTVAAALHNINNHLDADPKAKIVVVTNGQGFDFLTQDAKDSQGREFSSAFSRLAERGVQLRVSNTT